MMHRAKSPLALMALETLPVSSSLAPAQTPAQPIEVGVVFYADGDSYKALDKEAAPQSGRNTYSAKVKGAHAAVRLRAGSPELFRVCGVDPTRYKLFNFKSEPNQRTMTIYRANLWTGGSRTVFSESEIPMTIQSAESNCFTLKPKQALEAGEFGFSPVGSTDAFMFGVGEVK